MYLKRLKDLREDRDLKQVNIAEILKITRQKKPVRTKDKLWRYLRKMPVFSKTS